MACLGNLLKSAYDTVVSCFGIVVLRSEIVIFPVKFPVCREFSWRQVRYALRRQPGILAFCQAPKQTRNKAGNTGFLRISFRLYTPDSEILERQSAKVSGHPHEYSRFAEIDAGDRVRSALCGPPGSRSTVFSSHLFVKSGIFLELCVATVLPEVRLPPVGICRPARYFCLR